MRLFVKIQTFIRSKMQVLIINSSYDNESLIGKYNLRHRIC